MANKIDLIKLGSDTAKAGFQNERDIVNKFNNWKHDADAQKWLYIMGYPPNEIEYVKALVIFGFKTDVQVQITIKMEKAIDVENLQVKLVSNMRGFNQIDKRWVNKYVEMWNIPADVERILKHYTGENAPFVENPRDPRRMFMNEFPLQEQNL